MKQLQVPLLLALFLATTSVHSFPNGAPSQACQRIYPEGHGGETQDLDNNPYRLNISDFQGRGSRFIYQPGREYTISLYGVARQGFRGVLVQARTVADGSPVGTFANPASSDFKLSSCNPSESAVTHANSQLKTTADFRWTAPPEGTGDIQFLFAIVLRNSGGVSTFWATAQSNVIQENLKVRFAGGTPVVENNNTIRVTVEATRPSFTCVAELLAQGGRGAVISSSDCSNGSATFEEASTGINLRIRVIAKADGLKAVTKRKITIPDGAPKACTVHQINETVIDGSTATFEFQGLGVIAFYTCNIDRGPENFICISPVVLPNLNQGEHFIKVTPRGPVCNLPGGRKQPLRVKFEI